MKHSTASLLAGLALATTGAIAYTPSDVAWITANNSSGNPTSWLGTWQIDGSQETITDIVSTQDYGMKDKKQFRPKIGTATFNGKSLSVGALDRSSTGQLILRTANGCDTTFANEGLFLYAGQMQSWNAGSQIIRGKVTVRSPANAPFTVAFTDKGGSLTFRCPVEGESSTGLFFHSLASSSTSQNQTNFVCRFLDDALSSFAGTLEFSPVQNKNTQGDYTKTYNSNCKPPYFITFRTDSGTMPGTLTLYPNAIVAPETATTDFSVDSLNVVSFGWSTNYLDVAISADASACSLLRVTNSLSLSTPVVVRPTIATDAATDSALDYGDLHLFAATNAAAATRLAILKAPAGATLDAFLFSLGHDDALPHLPLYELEVSTDAADGLSTLWLVRKPAVWLTAADTSTYTSFTSNARWSDKTAANSSKDYVAFFELRTPGNNNATEQTFPGASLTIVSNVMLSVRSDIVRFDDLRIFGKARIGNLANGRTSGYFVDSPSNYSVVNGRIRIDTPQESTPSATAFVIHSYPGKAWTFNAEISGHGTLYLQGGTSQSGVSTPRNGWYAILGLNTNYFGTIHVHNDAASAANDLRTHLLVNDPRNLGAPLPTFLFDALTLDWNCALRPIASLTLDDESRGIHMAKGRTFLTTDNGITLTLKERITYGNGVVVKDGAGELALGGPQPWFTTGGSTTPASDKNVLDVREGTLCPVSAEAFQGLSVVITNGATLAVNVPASNTDGGIGQYGMLDTTWDAPLTVPSTGLTVTVRDPDGVLASGARIRRVPVCTVNAAGRTSLEGKLSVSGPVDSGYAAVPAWIDNGDGTHTFAAELRRGTTIFLR